MKKKITRHINETFKLAIPSAIARTGILAMGFVDTLMVSRYSSLELAYFGIANALIMFLVVIFISLTTGIPVVCSQEYGSGKYDKCIDTWFSSLPYCFIISFISMLLCFFAEHILIMLGQDKEMAKSAGQISRVFSYSFPFIMFYVCSSGFLEGVKKPRYAMVVIFIANILNVFFNWIFIYGKFGLEAMGAVGASWSTVINRFVVAVLMLIYILPLVKKHSFDFTRTLKIFDKKNSKMRQIGYGAAFSKGSEVLAFFIVTLFAGYLGTLKLASFSIAMNLINLFYMVSAGFAAAATVRVGIAFGEENAVDVSLAGWTALIMNFVIMAILSIIIALSADVITAVYTNDEVLFPLAKSVISFSGWVIVVSGCQIVISSALRGRGDILFPSIVQAGCYLFIMSFCSWFLAFKFNLDVIGLLLGMIIASFLSTVILSIRFNNISNKDYI